ncbi:bile acid 7-alpha dehydratase [Cupriavidus sp. UYMMa02A]|nr:bile acid 7-alpha dehydratase [Cupriavidus sp. UYMMa02A]
MSPSLELEQRLRKLEDLEAIRQLKARYFFCCDQKDPQGVRDCFASGQVLIDYGRLGVFHERDQLVELFERLGCHEHIVEMHHGVNPQLTVADADHAYGTWGLHYQQIDTHTSTLTQFGAYYEDEYRKLDGAWKIISTRCVVTSTMALQLDAATVRTLFAGRAPLLAEAPAS